MKSLLATTAVVILATTATAAVAGSADPAPVAPVVAAPIPVQADDWTGLYAGVTGGWSMGETVGVGDFDGILYGGFLGYNYQFDGGFVLGAEAAFTTGELEFNGGGTFEPTYIDLKARAGIAVDRALVYASGGYTIANFANNDEGAGFNVGAGVDFLVFDNVFVGVEYIYRDIEDTVANPAAWNDTSSTIQARVGITF